MNFLVRTWGLLIICSGCMRRAWFCLFLFFECVVVICFVLVWNWTFHNPTCDAMFHCGCTWNWAGGWDECNVHSTDPEVLKCPYCSSPPSVSWITEWGVMFCMVLSYYMVAYGKSLLSCCKQKHNQQAYQFPTSPINLMLRLLIPTCTFFIASMVVGFAFFLNSDYDKFLFYST